MDLISLEGVAGGIRVGELSGERGYQERQK